MLIMLYILIDQSVEENIFRNVIIVLKDHGSTVPVGDFLQGFYLTF